MYFKRLELYGFKSFAERTVLEFEPGITAIVGPNGCGKSNIADAIKWVLGEQNPRELRGAKMEDVIFNGTHLKEPVNFAEVSLTLSNEGKIFPIDYAEITVSRRLFRSGESEYLLNKVPVRLKDIQELFLGTGIGTSAYSLLEQGKIDLILSSRAEDRRFVFEEAAGITKFKSQKREALRKLEDTENNLIRVNDIISEVNRQISSLERQAKKAQRYQEIFNILKEKEIKYNKYLILQWEDKKKDLLREKETLQKEEEEFLKRLHCGEEQIREKRVGLEKLEEEISLEEVNRTGIETSLEKNLSRIALNRERIKELNERNLSLEAENKVLGEKIENDKNNLQELRNQFEDFCRSEAEKKAELKDKQDWLEKINREIKENEDLLSNSRLQLIEINQAMTKLRNDLTKLSTENHSLQARLRRLELEKTKAEEEKGRLNSLFREREKIVEEKKSLLENKLKYLQELDKEINRLGKQEESLNEDFQKKEIEQRALASRIEILEEMRRCYEGYSPGVKSLMLAKKNGDLPEAEIIGVLAELIEVESGYERLVEVVLGNYVQTILVKDDKSFSLCLDYIKKNKLSEINFLILEGLEKEVVPANNLGEGFNYLIDFVHLPAPYEFILPHLFAETILVNTLEEGLQLKKEKRDLSFRWVTPQGEMGERNFVKSAPLPAEEGIAIVGREKRIKDLKNELVHIEEEKKEIFAKREAISQELEKNKQDLLKTKEEEHLLEIELSNLGQEMERMQKDLKRIEDELSVLVLEIEETSQEIKSRTEEIEKAGGDLKDLELKEQKIKNLLEETSHNQEEKNVLREKILLEITEMELGLKSYIERVAFLKERVSRLESSLVEAEKMVSTRSEEKVSNLEKIKHLQEEITTLEKENLLLGKKKEDSQEKLSALNMRKIEMKSEIEKEEENSESIQQSLDNLRNNLHALEIKLQEIDFQKRDILQKMESNYKVNLETIEIDFSTGDFDPLNWEREINSLREKLSSLGPVNLIAIEEFGQLQERHNFLLAQQADLCKAKESLHEAITRINRTAKELFIETFQKIEVNFKEIFRLLFGGGNVQLFLLDPEDVLESGIEIIAQPPGKKLQNISLLSGGEKALTAVSLLFAIFKVKPSPFCILDEVDAPLDEANIDRFRMLMKEFSKASQFIVITHNKKTIAVADVMYGVTMEESGVSKLVSVKFLESADKVKVETAKT